MYMRFLNATVDIAFKRLFGSQGRTSLTISFLNSILERKEGERITEIVINDTANIPVTIDKKTSFVDVSCTDQAGKKYIIEMQVINERNFIERSQYYTAFFLARQLEKRDNYDKLVPVIFIGVVSFDLFKNSDYLSHHLIMNSETHEQTLQHFEFHFIELSKFHKTIDELETVADKWIYLIQNSENIEKIPDQLKRPQEMAEALHVLERGYWTEFEFQSYLIELDEWRRKESYESALQYDVEKIKNTKAEVERLMIEVEKSRTEVDRIKNDAEKARFEVDKIKNDVEQSKLKMKKEQHEIVQKMFSVGVKIEDIAHITGFNMDEIKTIVKK